MRTVHLSPDVLTSSSWWLTTTSCDVSDVSVTARAVSAGQCAVSARKKASAAGNDVCTSLMISDVRPLDI